MVGVVVMVVLSWVGCRACLLQGGGRGRGGPALGGLPRSPVTRWCSWSWWSCVEWVAALACYKVVVMVVVVVQAVVVVVGGLLRSPGCWLVTVFAQWWWWALVGAHCCCWVAAMVGSHGRQSDEDDER